MAKLHYFNGRGRAELIRLTLGACGVPFSDVFYTERSQYLKTVDDGKLLFNQLPLLEIEGKNLVQSNSIVRYLGRQNGLCGKNDDETTQIDQIYEGGRDFLTTFLGIGFRPEADVLSEVKEKVLPKYLPLFEKIASANGSGFFVGNGLTIADLSVLEPLLLTVEYFGSEALADFPAVKKIYDTVTSVKNVDAFLKGPQRQRKNDDEYIADVKRVLNR